VSNLEGIRPDAEAALIGEARQSTWQMIDEIAALLKPGMTESEAIRLANKQMAERGVRKFWHRTHIRFGASTILSFEDPYKEGVTLNEDDIVNIDIGPIWNGIEGDAGCPIVFGNDPQKTAIAAAAKSVFEDVRRKWQNGLVSGNDLLNFAEQRTQELGYVLHPTYVKGHRLSEFPHKIYSNGQTLFDLKTHPLSKRWVLEIHICDVDYKFGAFYEDLLL
jgi:Xaa-Pro aminopeptidase